MRVPFTKMQGAGNDFVVLDETRGRWHLSAQQYRFLADRHFGVGGHDFEALEVHEESIGMIRFLTIFQLKARKVCWLT